jgi:hypothetical protein
MCHVCPPIYAKGRIYSTILELRMVMSRSMAVLKDIMINTNKMPEKAQILALRTQSSLRGYIWDR